MFCNFYKKYKTVVAIIVGSFVIFSLFPFALDYFIFGNHIQSNLNNSEWSSFLGSYTGGVIGGIATLIAVIISLNISRKIQNESELRENNLII